MTAAAPRAKATQPVGGGLILSRGGVTLLKSITADNPDSAIVEAARMFDILSPTRRLSPVRLIVQVGNARAQFDATWPVDESVGTLDAVRRGYFAPRLVRRSIVAAASWRTSTSTSTTRNPALSSRTAPRSGR